jgi:hypothetical protein
MQVLREPTKIEMYCVYATLECKVPSNNDEKFDYVCPTEQVLYATTEKRRERKKIQEICKSVCTPMKNGYSMHGLLFTLLQISTYILIPLFVAVRSKWLTVDMYRHDK